MHESVAEPNVSSGKRSSARRWAGILLRTIHLVAVITLGAIVLGAPLRAFTPAVVALASGLVMLALDVGKRPGHLLELAGFTTLIKIALVVWMAADERVRPLLFWLIVILSAVVSHAPAPFRHLRLLGASADEPLETE